MHMCTTCARLHAGEVAVLRSAWLLKAQRYPSSRRAAFHLRAMQHHKFMRRVTGGSCEGAAPRRPLEPKSRAGAMHALGHCGLQQPQDVYVRLGRSERLMKIAGGRARISAGRLASAKAARVRPFRRGIIRVKSSASRGFRLAACVGADVGDVLFGARNTSDHRSVTQTIRRRALIGFFAGANRFRRRRFALSFELGRVAAYRALEVGKVNHAHVFVSSLGREGWWWQ